MGETPDDLRLKLHNALIFSEILMDEAAKALRVAGEVREGMDLPLVENHCSYEEIATDVVQRMMLSAMGVFAQMPAYQRQMLLSALGMLHEAPTRMLEMVNAPEKSASTLGVLRDEFATRPSDRDEAAACGEFHRWLRSAPRSTRSQIFNMIPSLNIPGSRFVIGLTPEGRVEFQAVIGEPEAKAS